jgi:hypothetical protein
LVAFHGDQNWRKMLVLFVLLHLGAAGAQAQAQVDAELPLLLSAFAFDADDAVSGEDNRGTAIEFSVHRTCRVAAVGFVDAGLPGINGTLRAIVVNRSTREIVLGPFVANNNSGTRADGDAFLFVDVSDHPNATLSRGLYALVSYGFVNDQKLRSFKLPPLVSGRPLSFTGLSEYDRDQNALVPFHTHSVFDETVGLGATLRFEPEVTQPLPATEFVSCEAVKCASLPSGRYNIAGKIHFCENDIDGGGWLRLLRVNESSCEALGWTSSRNPNADESQGIGCRAVPALRKKCSFAQLTAPFLIRDVRGLDWDVLSMGSPDGFLHNSKFNPVTEKSRGHQQLDGVILRVDGGPLLWTYAVGASMSECEKCGGKLQCSFSARRSRAQFREPEIVTRCGNVSAFDFNQALDKADAASSLLVGLCADQDESDEDFLVRRGDILVRSIAGFTGNEQQCAGFATATTTQTTQTQTLTLQTTTQTQTQTMQTQSAESAIVDTSWIAPTAVASLLFVLLVGAGVLLLKRSRSGSEPKQQQPRPQPQQNQYGSISVAQKEFTSSRDYGSSALSQLD